MLIQSRSQAQHHLVLVVILTFSVASTCILLLQTHGLSCGVFKTLRVREASTFNLIVALWGADVPLSLLIVIRGFNRLSSPGM